MSFRFLAVAFMLLLLSACASDGSKTSGVGDENGVVHETITPGPLGDSMMGAGPIDGSPLNPVAPGTQADLEINVGSKVYFGYDRYDITPEGRETLKLQADWLRQYPNLRVIIEGHTDERGTREYNLALGERRANSVRNYLIALGVSPVRISTISYGKERPEVMESTPAAWAQNRRSVTIVE